ncbi:MAG: carbohydrate kinase family protein [Candidatus Kerfeldbacteria bacterium]
MAKTFDVVSVGSALRDVMFYTKDCSVVKNPKKDPTRVNLLCVEFGAKIQSEKVTFTFGGGAANTSINFAGLGLRTGVLSSIGYDLDGRGIKEHMEANKVDTELLLITQRHRTGFSYLVVDENSGEHTAYVYYGAAHDLEVARPSLVRRPTKWYYISSLYSDSWRDLLRTINSIDKSKVAWNPGSRQLEKGYRGLKPFIEKTDLMILNKDEATELILSHPKKNKAGTIPQMLKEIHSWGPGIVLITNSRKGAYAYDGAEVTFLKPPQDRPKDTTGAGDCYGSSFLAGYVKYKGNIMKSMKLAQKNASSLVQSIGAQNGLLKWKDLPKSLKK